MERGKFRTVRVVLFMIVANEAVEFVATAVGLFDLPLQKRSERVPLHQTVEKSGDLLGFSDKLTLNRRKYVGAVLHPIGAFP